MGHTAWEGQRLAPSWAGLHKYQCEPPAAPPLEIFFYFFLNLGVLSPHIRAFTSQLPYKQTQREATGYSCLLPCEGEGWMRRGTSG